MNQNLDSICRVCLSSGSRNIFEKSSASNDSQFSIPAIGENVSSLDRLVEKLRYVTMLKVDECENLPKNMCDSCIIQLNVAYNLKKNAIQSDMKLRQYMIEFGINVTSYTTCSINTVSVIHPPAMIMPAATTSESLTITTAKSTTLAPQQPQPPPPLLPVQVQPQQLSQPHRPFPVMPVIIKEEPIDYEDMSDITVDTNTEAFVQHMRNQQTQRNRTNGNNSTASTGSGSNKSVTPLPVHSMVSVSKSSMPSPQASSDSEFISAYMLTSSLEGQSKKTTTTMTTTTTTTSMQSKSSVTKQKNLETLSKASPKSKRSNESPSRNANKTPVKLKNRELDKLNDDTAIRMKNAKLVENTSPRRQTRQQYRVINDNENQRPPSRSRSGTKTDYKSFFRLQSITPVTNGIRTKLIRRMSRNDVAVKRKGRSPPNAKTPRNTKQSAAIVRKRRHSMVQNRTSI